MESTTLRLYHDGAWVCLADRSLQQVPARLHSGWLRDSFNTAPCKFDVRIDVVHSTLCIACKHLDCPAIADVHWSFYDAKTDNTAQKASSVRRMRYRNRICFQRESVYVYLGEVPVRPHNESDVCLFLQGRQVDLSDVAVSVVIRLSASFRQTVPRPVASDVPRSVVQPSVASSVPPCNCNAFQRSPTVQPSHQQTLRDPPAVPYHQQTLTAIPEQRNEQPSRIKRTKRLEATEEPLLKSDNRGLDWNPPSKVSVRAVWNTDPTSDRSKRPASLNRSSSFSTLSNISEETILRRPVQHLTSSPHEGGLAGLASHLQVTARKIIQHEIARNAENIRIVSKTGEEFYCSRTILSQLPSIVSVCGYADNTDTVWDTCLTSLAIKCLIVLLYTGKLDHPYCLKELFEFSRTCLDDLSPLLVEGCVNSARMRGVSDNKLQELYILANSKDKSYFVQKASALLDQSVVV